MSVANLIDLDSVESDSRGIPSPLAFSSLNDIVYGAQIEAVLAKPARRRPQSAPSRTEFASDEPCGQIIAGSQPLHGPGPIEPVPEDRMVTDAMETQPLNVLSRSQRGSGNSRDRVALEIDKRSICTSSLEGVLEPESERDESPISDEYVYPQEAPERFVFSPKGIAARQKAEADFAGKVALSDLWWRHRKAPICAWLDGEPYRGPKRTTYLHPADELAKSVERKGLVGDLRPHNRPPCYAVYQLLSGAFKEPPLSRPASGVSEDNDEISICERSLWSSNERLRFIDKLGKRIDQAPRGDSMVSSLGPQSITSLDVDHETRTKNTDRPRHEGDGPPGLTSETLGKRLGGQIGQRRICQKRQP